MAQALNLERYEIYDSQSGCIYAVFVPAAEVAALDLDHKRRNRLLSQVKAAGDAPVGRFAESLSNSTVLDVSLWQPPGGHNKGPQASSSPSSADSGQQRPPIASSSQVVRASGKTGATWPKENAECFLKQCHKYKADLRRRVVPISVWQTISDELFCLNLNYSAEQLKEKMRNLKRSFNEAKKGLHLGEKWDYFPLMRELFDLPITDDLDDSCVISDSAGKTYVLNSPVFQEDFLRRKATAPITSMTATPASTTTGPTNKVSEIISICSGHRNDENDYELVAIEEHPDEMTAVSTTTGPTTKVSGIISKTYTVCKGYRTDENDNDLVEIEEHPDEVTVINNTATYLNGNPASPFDYGKTYTVQSPIFQHPTSGVDQIGINTSLLSLRNDEDGEETSLRSPAKKKLNSKVFNSPFAKRTPEKTPKRKVSQNSLVWPMDVLQLFLSECVKRKEELSLTRPPLTTWKDISEELGHSGHNQYNWEVCRAKFEAMKTFFLKTLIPAGGMICGVKSHYYDDFCKIFDVGSASKTMTGFWDTEKTNLLLTLYEDKKDEFDSSRNRHEALYEQIANEMSMFDLPQPPTGKQCRDHIADLKYRFRTEYDNARKTGAAPSKWPYFDRMMDIFKGCVTLEPPTSLSVGTTTELLQKGKPATKSLESGSRTRTVVTQPQSARNRTIEKPQKMTKASWQQSSNAIANELRLTREGMEKRSDARWNDLLQILKQNKSTSREYDKNFTL